MQTIQNELGITVSIGVTKNIRELQPIEIFSRLKNNVQQAKKYGKNLIYSL